MIPRGPLGRVQFGNLRVYPGPEHPHEAQQPEIVDVASMNRKNMRPHKIVRYHAVARSVGGVEAGRAGSAKYVKKVDRFGRAYATGKRKDAVGPRLDSSRGPARSPSTPVRSKSISPVRCCG